MTTVLRTNRALNPRAVQATDGGGWTALRGFGTNGAGTYTWLTAQAAPDASGVTTARRKAWTTATTTASSAVAGTGFEIRQATSTYFSVLEGEQLTVSIYIRSNTVKRAQLTCEVWNGTAAGTATLVRAFPGGTWLLEAGKWARLSATFTVPTGGQGLRIIPDILEDATGQLPTWLVGDNLDVTGLLIEIADQQLTYFDGSTTATPPQACVWTGPINNSASVLTTTDVPADSTDTAPVLDPWPPSSGVFSCDTTASGYEGVISVFGIYLPPGRGTVSRVTDEGELEIIRGGQDVDISSGTFVLADTEATFDQTSQYVLNLKPTIRATFHNYFRNPSFEASTTTALTWLSNVHRKLSVAQREIPDPVYFGSNIGIVGAYTGGTISAPPTNDNRLLLYTQPDLTQLTWKPNTSYRITGRANIIPELFSWMQARSDPASSSPILPVPPANPWSKFLADGLSWNDLLGYGEGEELDTRTNRAINPRAVDTPLGGWETESWGIGGNGTLSWQTNLPGPSGTGITTSRRKTWTKATTASTPDSQSGLTVFASSQEYFPCTPGEVITVSVWYRHSSVTAKQLLLWVFTVDRVSRIGAAGITPYASTIVASAGAGIWQRVSLTFTAAAGVNGFRVNPDIAAGGTSQTWAVGEYMEATGMMIEVAPAVNPYFDGESAGAEWAGVPNQSTSVIRTVGGEPMRGTLYAGFVDANGALIPSTALTELATIESSGLRQLHPFDAVMTTPGTIPSTTHVGIFQGNGLYQEQAPIPAAIVGTSVAGESTGQPTVLTIPTNSATDAKAIKMDDWLYVAYAASDSGKPAVFSGAGWEEALPLQLSGTPTTPAVVRTNVATNPRADGTGLLGWMGSNFGVGGAGTGVYQTGQTGPAGTGITTTYRKTWTTATTASTPAQQTGITIQNDATTRFPCTANTQYTVSVYYRYNSAKAKSWLLQVAAYDAAGSAIAYYPNTSVAATGANTWQRVSLTFTAPANAATFLVIANVNSGVNNQEWAINDWLEATGVLVETGATTGAYFDGSSTGGVWSGIPNKSASTYTIPAVGGGWWGIYRKKWLATDTSPINVIPTASQTFSLLAWWVRGTDKPPTIGVPAPYRKNDTLVAPGVTPLNAGRRTTIAFGRMTASTDIATVTNATAHTNAPSASSNSSIKLVLTDNPTLGSALTPDVIVNWPNTGPIAGRHYDLTHDRSYLVDLNYIAGAAIQMVFEDGIPGFANLEEFNRGWMLDGLLLDELSPTWPFPGPTYFDGSTRFPDDQHGIGYTMTYPDTTSFAWDSGDQTNVWTGTPNGSASLFTGASVLGAYSASCVLKSSDFVDGVDLCEPVFLSDPILPDLAMWVGLFRIENLAYAARRTLIDVLGRHAPVALSQYRSTPSTSFTFYTATLAQRTEFIKLINSGRILLLRNPDPSYPESMWYLSLGGVSEVRIFPDHRMPARKWEVEAIQVDRPSVLIAAEVGQSWERLRDEHVDWMAVREDFVSWFNVLVAPDQSSEAYALIHPTAQQTSASNLWTPVP